MPSLKPPPLKVAVPKGRILKQLIPRFQSAGLETSPLEQDSRKLVRQDAANTVQYLLLKPSDVPTYVEYGAADIGIAGRDVLLERNYDLYAPVDLGIGKCQMMVCGLANTPLRGTGDRPLRIATKYPNITSKHFRDKGEPVEVVFMNGSVELAPLTGLADAIVDLVETGETLRQNGLVTLEWICDVSSVLVANRSGLKLRRESIAPIVDALRKSP